MSSRQESGADPQATLGLFVAGLVLAGLGLLVIEVPVLVWGLLHGDPLLLNPAVVLGAGIRLALSASEAAENLSLSQALGVSPGVLPPLWVAIVINVMLFSGLGLLIFGGWLRVDRWRGTSQFGSASWSPRTKVRRRAWAKPRDVLHLQPIEGSRSGLARRWVNRPLRFVAGERRAPEPVGGANWPLGFVRGAELRSSSEHNGGVIAPTGAGKNVRVFNVVAREAMGPVVIGANKMEVITATIDRRQAIGPVWIYAPLSDLSALGPRARSCSWSPLGRCGSWSGALAMAQWLYDADPHASATSTGSDGARFYNREAIESLLPSVLHAAALGGRRMVDVLGWLRGGVDALDEPRDILFDHGAVHAAQALAAVQAPDMADRTRALLTITAAQLVGAYRFPEVAAVDRRGFDINRLLAENGTLYLLAPESQQDMLAPLFGGILGEAFRTCEDNANRVADRRTLPVLKVLLDEAAHLAPLGKLATYLAVCRAWNVRMFLSYQSIGQIRSRYGDQADAVLANLMTKIFLGPIHDQATREEVIGLLGGEEVTRTSRTHDGWGARRSMTEHEQETDKINAAELAQLREGDGIVVHGRDLPIKVALPTWWEIDGARTSAEAHRRELEHHADEREWRSR